MSLNLATGQWEDDEHPDGGSIGEQIGAPVSPMPPPPTQAPGPEAPSPAPAPTVPGAHGPDDVLPPSPGTEPAPPPALPSVAPAPLNFPAPVPAGGVVSPAESANLAAIGKTTAGKAQTATQQGQLNAAGARARSDAADRDLAEQQRFIDEQKRILDESQKKTAERTAQANADWNAYKETGIKDPEADKSFGRRFLEAIMVGLGAYNSAINKGPNTALDIIQQATKDNIDAQKAKIEKLYQTAQRSGKNVEEATKERDDALAQLNLKHSAQLATGADMLRQQLSKIGIPQAQIDANVDIQKLDGEALQKREDTLKGIREDETKLAQANIAAAARKAKAGAGAPKGPISELAEMKQNGADPATIQRRAEQLHIKPKDYLPVIKDIEAGSKPGGGGIGSVRQNAVLGNLAEAERAAKEIKVGAIPPETIQKLQFNEERAAAAHHSAQSGVAGALGAAAMRGVGAAPRGRYDGIPADQQKQITAAEQVITHLTEMQQGKNIETLEQYRERYSPYVPGLSPEEVKRREAALPKLVAEQRATQDPTGVGSKRLRAAEGGDDPRIQAAQSVLNDPEKSKKLTPAERAFLLKTVKAAKKPAPANNGGNPQDDIVL